MIGHQAERIKLEIGDILAASDLCKETVHIFIVFKDCLAVDSAQHNMIDIGPAQFSRFSWHAYHLEKLYHAIIFL
jgi:hypothetical protein